MANNFTSYWSDETTVHHFFPAATSPPLPPPPPPSPSHHMTDRDTFAAAALTGLLSDDGDRIDSAMTDFTRRSYEWADAMLRERGVVACEPTKTTLTNDERRAIKFAIEIFEVEGKNATFEQLTLRRLLKYTLERLLERTA